MKISSILWFIAMAIVVFLPILVAADFDWNGSRLWDAYYGVLR